MITLLYILEGLVLIIFLIVFVVMCIWMFTGYRSQTPFGGIPNSILKDIYEVMDLKENSVVYNLGCGDGRFLFYVANRMPKARYVGFEKSLVPLMFAKIKSWWYQRKTGTKIEFTKKDFFKYDLSKATHVVSYLYPNTMDDLLPKLDEELKSGVKLISVSFKFTQKKPKASLDLSRGKYSIAKELYIYEF